MWPIVLLLFPTVSSQFLNNENQDRSIALADFAHQILTNECSQCKTVLVVHSGQELACEIFLERVTGAVSFYTLSVDADGASIEENVMGSMAYMPDFTIIFIDTDIIDSMETFIFSIELLSIWNIRGPFLVVSDGDTINEDLDTWLQETFESFWERQAMRILVAIWQEDGGISTFTFDPYYEDYKIEVSEKNRTRLWFDRRVTNMNGKPIKLYQFDTVLADAAVRQILPDGTETWVGRDGMFFSTMAESMNASIMVHGLSDDFSDELIQDADPSVPLDNYLGLFSDIFDFDMLFNRMVIYPDNKLDHVFLYERSDLRLIVPRSGMVPQYLYLMMLVPVNVWGAVLLTLTGVSIARWVLGGKYAPPFLDNVSFLLGTTAPDRPRMRSPERFLLALWMFGCLVLDTLFQTTLMSTLVAPKYYADVDTMQDLANSDIMVYGPEYTNIQISRILISAKDAEFMRHLLNVPKEDTIYGENIDWTDGYKDGNAITSTQEQTYRLIRTNRALLDTHHVMTESPMPSAVAYNIPKNKLYFEEMQRVFNTIQEAGLHLHWRDYDYFLNREIQKSNSTSTTATTKNQILTLFHLQSAFFILILGLTNSLLVFCCELVCCRRKQDQIEYMN